jgi:hypothetical protein
MPQLAVAGFGNHALWHALRVKAKDGALINMQLRLTETVEILIEATLTYTSHQVCDLVHARDHEFSSMGNCKLCDEKGPAFAAKITGTSLR